MSVGVSVTFMKTLRCPVNPMFAWAQIVNDVTILGEDLRRGREPEAVNQAGDVLTRLLEFIGYYLFVHKIEGKVPFADFVAETLRIPAYVEFLPKGLQDGPSWWVMYKYPFVCAKCGRLPCHCLIQPWVLEKRREDPGPYLEKFRKVAEEVRGRLRESEHGEFTISGLIKHFRMIYEASYYYQDAWKIGMHLSEELGEAMTELGRMEIVCHERSVFNLDAKLDLAFKIARDRLQADTAKITDPASSKQRKQEIEKELRDLELDLRKGNPWELMARLIGERFKEEIADVLSWVSAIVVKLDPDLVKLASVPRKFVKVTAGGVKVLACPWCREDSCTDGCLVLHGVSGEIREKVSKF